jgi:hypothetical protein
MLTAVNAGAISDPKWRRRAGAISRDGMSVSPGATELAGTGTGTATGTNRRDVPFQSRENFLGRFLGALVHPLLHVCHSYAPGRALATLRAAGARRGFGPSGLLAGYLRARNNDREGWRARKWTYRDGL